MVAENNSSRPQWLTTCGDHHHTRAEEEEEQRSKQDDGAAEKEEYVIPIPSKVSVKSRHLFPTSTWNSTHDQMGTFAKQPPLRWTITILLVFLSSFSSSVVAAFPQEDEGVCPVKCACLDSYVQCTKLNLEIAPSRVPKWAELLDLSNNRLSENVNESVANLPELKDLRLKRNGLQNMPVFQGLLNLDKLTLSHNRINHVSAEAIAALPRLEHLDLSRNMIKVLATGNFPLVNILKVLNLEANRIAEIQRNALNGLVQLTDLKLKGNNLVSVTAEIFQRMRQLKKLQLSGNRIEVVNGLTFKHLSELRVLQLRNNRIRLLQPGAFHGLNNIEKLELDNNRLTSVSKDWLFNLTSLQTLSLSNNSISAIDYDSWDFVIGLNTLELSHNRLDAIEATTWEKLINLMALYLRSNRIKTISEHAFRYVPQLQTLDLSHNQISSAIEDLNAPFVSLTQLQRFDLSANRIMSINQRAFIGLTSLLVLDLTGNNVTTIQNSAFNDLVALTDLLIDSPTILCDCQLQWFHGWLWELQGTQRESILEKLKPVCHYPVWLRGRMLMELNVKNFTCNDSPKPKIIEEPPKTLLALRGKNLNLTCTATTTSQKELKFSWRRDNVEVNPVLYKKTVLHSPTEFDNSTVVSSVLELQNVNQNHVGNYQCIVANDYGSTYSMKHKITVGTLPTFKKVPSNKTVNAGETIRLDCAVSGEPRASLAWLKDGGNDFPAARERRMHVMTEDDVFFITNAKVHDAGIYSCSAENVVGVVHANATIVVLEAPVIVKPLEDKEVLPGTPTVLECMTSGSPRPQLRWTKDGQPISDVSERYYFAAEDQLLVIMDSQARDAGVYECEIWNELGTDTGRMQLSVVAQTKKVVQAQFDSLSIIIIIAVCCILGTSIIWLVIIYKTRKPGGGANNARGGMLSSGSGTAINNSAMATMLAVGEGQLFGGGGNGGGEYARTSLLTGVSGTGSPRIINQNDSMGDGGESLYMQQQNHLGLLRNVSPVRLNRLSEPVLVVRRREEEDSRSCKDSGNGDSAKERNPTSSSSSDEEAEEMDEMIELQEKRRGLNPQVSIQRNRLNEYLGDDGDVLYVVGGKNNNCQQQQMLMSGGGQGGVGLRSMCGSTFKGSSGSVLGGGVGGAVLSSSSSGNCSSLSNNNMTNNSAKNNVAYGGDRISLA